MKYFPDRQWTRWLLLAPAALALIACTPNSAVVDQAATVTDAAPQAASQSDALALDAAQSHLSFVSLKNNAIAEVHTFRDLSGEVSASGEVVLRIALASVATGIELRDQRLRDLLFEAAKFPEAVVASKIDPQSFAALPAGGHVVENVSATLAMHGITYPLTVPVRITRTGPGEWLATTEQPVIVDAVNFGLMGGIDELRKVAGLQAIASGVPVAFTLAFRAASE